MAAAYETSAAANMPDAGPATRSQPPPMFSDSAPDLDVHMDELSMPELLQQLWEVCWPESSTAEEVKSRIEAEYLHLLENAHENYDTVDGIDDQFVGDEQPKDTDEEIDDEFFDFSVLAKSQYFPYPSKLIMVLDVLDNLPRCRFTSDQINLILNLLTQLGHPSVPSLKTFRRIQKGLQHEYGTEPEKVMSHLGNIFYMNSICETLARDMANPLIAPHLHFYPEETTGPISETYQAERWMEYEPSQLTPMLSKGFKRFWIEEVARLADGQFIIPHLWILRDRVLHCVASVISLAADGRWSLLKEQDVFPADNLELDYLDIQGDYGENLEWVDSSSLVDDDEDLFVVMVSPWADDVSGNRSKQYNKHMNMYTGNGCLPGRLLQQEFNVHFMCSSPHASSAEQFAAFRDQVKATETKPVKSFNAATQRKAVFIIRVPGLPADNPQQSEECSHMGSNANFPCRKCLWGGTKVEKETDHVYHDAHLEGVARSAEGIRVTLTKQLEFAMLGDTKSVEELQRTTGTKDKITQYWIGVLVERARAEKAAHPRCSAAEIAADLRVWLDEQPGDKMNPLLDILGLDPFQDTPRWSDEDRRLLAIRFQSTDLSGLTYRNNLIGKHFKTIMQILALHAHDMSTPEEFTLMQTAGDLGPMLWIPEIDDMEKYIPELTTASANLLDVFDAVDPLRILVKIKLHLLAHLPKDIRRFGPAIRSSTEVYEAFNGVFRLCSIFSNHRAPSRDIARKFAAMDRVKHLLSGGYWLDASSRQWIQAGEGVQRLLRSDHVAQRHLGRPWAGVKACAMKFAPFEWKDSKAGQHWESGDERLPPASDSLWRPGHGDKVPIGAWVVACHQKKTLFGRIAELLVGEDHTFATLEEFVCSETCHPVFGWPILRRPAGAEIIAKTAQLFRVLDPKTIQFVISCKPAVVGKEMQEREETNRDISLIKHTDDDHFLILMSGLRHYAHIKPLYSDREKLHKEAAKARGTRQTNRKKAVARRRENAAGKKKAAQEAAKAAEDAARQAAEAERAAQEAEEADAHGDSLPDEEPDREEGGVPEMYQDSDSESGGSETEEDDDADEYIHSSGRQTGRETWAPARKKRKRF
ncbi:hypothetical protein GGX14DRAFT_535928 [Mycena pura]|uniref:Uncharacterized protein n=1 Tax=Mycena pura TaxID=153505 RepID=A0AAD6YB46_9AGAR|nr:hypothetical protein GGX14DRAFT_535928 [Mycena pura]